MKNEVKGAMRIRCYSCKIDSRMKYGIFKIIYFKIITIDVMIYSYAYII